MYNWFGCFVFVDLDRYIHRIANFNSTKQLKITNNNMTECSAWPLLLSSFRCDKTETKIHEIKINKKKNKQTEKKIHNKPRIACSRLFREKKRNKTTTTTTTSEYTHSSAVVTCSKECHPARVVCIEKKKENSNKNKCL